MNLVAYYRVSTRRQGQSGLGLEAQRFAVEEYAKRTGAKVIREYVEIEKGWNPDRPELHKALSHARRAKAVLVVAKLDRLSRNVVFLSTLMESKVEFVCIDNPSATKLTLHILVAVAEDETRRISERTTAALQAYKARGGTLGTPANLTDEARAKGRAAGVAALKRAAREEYRDVLPEMQELRQSGASLQRIADELNERNYLTRTGKNWNKVQVMHVLRRAQA